MRAVLAAAAPGAAKVAKEAARTAAANIPRQTRKDHKSAEKAIGRADVVMFPCFFGCAVGGVSLSVKQYGFTVHRCQFRSVLP
jgi:hypothetical protein